MLNSSRDPYLKVYSGTPLNKLRSDLRSDLRLVATILLLTMLFTKAWGTGPEHNTLASEPWDLPAFRVLNFNWKLRPNLESISNLESDWAADRKLD